MLHFSRLALLFGALATCLTPALAQNAILDAAALQTTTAPLQAALAQNATPMQLKASALDASWRRFKPLIVNERYESTFPNIDLFTRGETIAVGNQTFLVVYRAPNERKRPNLAMNPPLAYDDQAFNSTDVPSIPNTGDFFTTTDGYGRLLSDDVLRLMLINTAILSAMGDIRAFDTRVDIIDNSALSQTQQAQARAQIANQQSVSNLKQIALGLIQYTQDYDEKYPPMRSAQSMAQIKADSQYPYNSTGLATVQGVLYPYIKQTEVFVHPTTREIYRPNLNLSGRPLAALEVPSQVVAFYEASPAADGTRAVAYADGHVKRELETDWARIRALSDRFAPPLDFKKVHTYADSTGIFTGDNPTPRVKTALGANAALVGSKINVETLAHNNTVVLRGTTVTRAQKELAGAIARKNAPGYTIVNQLNVEAH